MTDEQRKQIEAEAARWAVYLSKEDQILAMKSFVSGARLGLSLADNRIKELEQALEESKQLIESLWSLLSIAYPESCLLYSEVINCLNHIENILTPTDNDKEQKG